MKISIKSKFFILAGLSAVFLCSCMQQKQEEVLKEGDKKTALQQSKDKMQPFYDDVDQDDHIQSLDGTFDSKTYESIELRIENQSGHAVLIKEESFDFPVVCIKEVFPEYETGFFFPYKKSLISECLAGRIPAYSTVEGVVFVKKGESPKECMVHLFDEIGKEDMIVQTKVLLEGLDE